MKKWLMLSSLVAALAAATACKDDDSSSNGSGDADTDTDSDGDTDTDSDGDADFGTCQASCSAAAECVPEGADATHDADNWSCGEGYCVHEGCLGDGECQEVYPDAPGIGCNGAGAPPYCAASCETAADCATEDSILFGEDNFACDDGLCTWLGCNSDTECADASAEGEMVCALYMAVPVCTTPCTAPADCVDPALSADLFGADHFACEDGACRHLGCLSDAECEESFHGAGSICVK